MLDGWILSELCKILGGPTEVTKYLAYLKFDH